MDQLVLLVIIGLISLVNWVMQKAAEKRELAKLEREEREAGKQSVYRQPPPKQRTAERRARSPQQDPLKELMEALGLPPEAVHRSRWPRAWKWKRRNSPRWSRLLLPFRSLRPPLQNRAGNLHRSAVPTRKRRSSLRPSRRRKNPPRKKRDPLRCADCSPTAHRNAMRWCWRKFSELPAVSRRPVAGGKHHLRIVRFIVAAVCDRLCLFPSWSGGHRPPLQFFGEHFGKLLHRGPDAVNVVVVVERL